MGLNGARSGVTEGLGGGGLRRTAAQGGLESSDPVEEGGNSGVGLSSFLEILFLKMVMVLV